MFLHQRSDSSTCIFLSARTPLCFLSFVYVFCIFRLIYPVDSYLSPLRLIYPVDSYLSPLRVSYPIDSYLSPLRIADTALRARVFGMSSAYFLDVK